MVKPNVLSEITWTLSNQKSICMMISQGTYNLTKL